MSNLLGRLKKRYDMTVQAYKNDCRFSKKLAWMRLLDDFSSRMHLKSFSNFMHQKKEKLILDYLFHIVKLVIEKYEQKTEIGRKVDKAPIWVCWWAGIESAPPLVKQCIKSIQKNAGEHPVQLITKENYQQYLEIPYYIYEKMQDGRMGLAHFADYLRVSLINKYGGLWLDATIFCAEKVPESYFETPFFTCKSPYRESRYLSHFQWVTFVLGGWKGNIWYSFMQEAFEAYWEKEDYAIDYLFFDSMIYLAKKYVPAIWKLMEDLPDNTPHRDDLQEAMNAALPESEFWKIIQKDTPIYKLSWREKYLRETGEGEKSIYDYFLTCDF